MRLHPAIKASERKAFGGVAAVFFGSPHRFPCIPHACQRQTGKTGPGSEISWPSQ